MGLGPKVIHPPNREEADERRLCAPTTFFWNGPKGQACCVLVHDSIGVGFSRCSGRGRYEEKVGDRVLYFCGNHRIENVRKRYTAKKERRAAWERQWAASRQADADRRELLQNAAVWKAALEKIAAGDNDARGTAREALGLVDEISETY